VPEGPCYWTRDISALALLGSIGGPFEREAFRSAHVTAISDSRDASYGGIAPDGTLAAIALIARGRTADSVPPSGYGGIRASRPLSEDEEKTFLRAARRDARSLFLSSRALELGRRSHGRAFATASVIRSPGQQTYSRLARRSLRKAERAGGSATRSDDPKPFLTLYRTASAHWAFRYPEPLIRLLAEKGAGVFHHVALDGEVVSSMFTLVDGTHWMCWLAAQNDRGRKIAASYLAYDAVLEEASLSVELVNLGANAPGSGGAEFKAHLGAIEVPTVGSSDSIAGWTVAQSTAARLRRFRSRFS
jgi:hypothetical protein